MYVCDRVDLKKFLNITYITYVGETFFVGKVWWFKECGGETFVTAD